MRGTRSFENTGAFAGSVQRIVRFASVALALFAFLAAMTISGFVPQVMAADPVHIHLDHWANGGSPQTAKKWVDGNLHWTNSHYAEGDADPVRFIMDNLQPGTTYTLQFSWLTTKKQGNGGTSVKHAHDFLANYTFSEFPAYTPTVGVPARRRDQRSRSSERSPTPATLISARSSYSTTSLRRTRLCR